LNSGTGLEFIRQKEKDDEPKVVMMQKAVWAQLCKAVEEVDLHISKEEYFKKELLNSKHITAEPWRQKMYVGLHTFGLKGIQPKLGMNLNMDEWEELKKKVQYISEQLAKMHQLKRKKPVTRHVHDENILVYTWAVYDEDDYASDEPVFECFTKFYTKASADRHMRHSQKKNPQFWSGDDNTFKWMLKQNYGAPPDIYNITKAVYLYYMSAAMCKAARANCPACKEGKPLSDEEHTNDKAGCVGLYHEKSDIYFADAMDQVNAVRMSKIMDTIQALMGSTLTGNFTYSNCFLRFSDADDNLRLLTGEADGFMLDIAMQLLLEEAAPELEKPVLWDATTLAVGE
jgi:hypothetical protein